MQTPNNMITTRRMVIYPTSEEELSSMIGKENDPNRRGRYSEMLENVKHHPDSSVWFTLWKISVRDDPQQQIGGIWFKGPQTGGTVEIDCEVNPEYQNKGYATEALKKVLEWTFRQENVYTIEVRTNEQASAAHRVLQKLKFKSIQTSENPMLWQLERTLFPWIAIYMCLGSGVGIAWHGMGACIGLLIGLTIGMIFETLERNKRKAIKEGSK